ncbi:hypothetical protein JYU04_02710 [Dehalococcoides mccartyi]|nr:hypothetical protein [Dehalococcoides mccartyi]
MIENFRVGIEEIVSRIERAQLYLVELVSGVRAIRVDQLVTIRQSLKYGRIVDVTGVVTPGVVGIE